MVAMLYVSFGKRLKDFVLALTALLVLSPVFLLVALMIRWSMGREILFRQHRLGRDCKSFTLLKFRTMNNAQDADGQLLSDEHRLTPIGRFLRRTSLDELPGLFNVLRGEMSLVGPRPLLARYLERYSAEQNRRHEVLPGLTGWAQIKGRNGLTWEEKFAHDVWYVDHQSCWLDIRILLMTVWVVLRKDGIEQPGQATMQEFMGG